MNNTTKVLIGCLVVTGLWIGLQNLNQTKPELVPACDVTAPTGG